MRALVVKFLVVVGIVGLTIAPLKLNGQSGPGTDFGRTSCDLVQTKSAIGEEDCDNPKPRNGLSMLAFFRHDRPAPESMKLATGYRLAKKFSVPGEGSQEAERVNAIVPPATPIPSEAQSAGVTQFSFIAYGDTRGRRDGIAIQYEHSLIVESMLTQIKKLKNTPYPVRFVLQSGDAVADGRDSHQWNISFVPLINRLTTEGGVSYFLVPGNHEATTSPAGLRNYLDAVSALIPQGGSPRRLLGYTTFSIGYGNTFVVGLDANIAGDEKQYQWVKSQLEGLDRNRYADVIIFCHQAPFSSGPHGGANVEQPTVELRTRYMPLFQTHHVRAVFSGHEHLFEHWVEHYTDATGTHRMDLIVSGGGGAPLYPYTGEPDLDGYLKANESLKVSLQHLVKPGTQDAPSPYHYVIVRVDGNKLDMRVIGVDWGRNFEPYRSNEVELRDPSAP